VRRGIQEAKNSIANRVGRRLRKRLNRQKRLFSLVKRYPGYALDSTGALGVAAELKLLVSNTLVLWHGTLLASLTQGFIAARNRADHEAVSGAIGLHLTKLLPHAVFDGLIRPEIAGSSSGKSKPAKTNAERQPEAFSVDR
jgi:hypothetical protein